MRGGRGERVLVRIIGIDVVGKCLYFVLEMLVGVDNGEVSILYLA